MIQPGTCQGCGRTLFTTRLMNLDVRLEIDPLDAQEAAAALIAGRDLWRLTATSLVPARAAELSALRTAEPGERPHIVSTHRCTASSRPSTPTPRQSPQPHPQSPPAGRTAPFSGPSAGPSSVPSAANPRFKAQERPQEPVCGLCSRPVTPGTYWGFQHGDRWVYAEHADACPA